MAFNLLTKAQALAGRLQAARVRATSGVLNDGYMQAGKVTINPGTSSYTITATDYIVVTSGACNPIQLPTIVGNAGRMLLIVSSSGTVAPAAAEKINASTATQVFTTPIFLFGSGSSDGWRTLAVSTS